MDPDDADVDFALPGLLALLYLALLGSALAYWLLFYLIDNLDPSQVSYVTVVNPVVAVLLGIVVLSEPITPLVCSARSPSCSGSTWSTGRPASRPNSRRSVRAASRRRCRAAPRPRRTGPRRPPPPRWPRGGP